MSNSTEPWLNAMMEKAHAQITSSALDQGILTLGGLRTALGLLPAGLPLVLDNGAAPSNLHSYRGYYERLSIGVTRYRDDYATKLHDGGPAFDSEYIGHYEPGADRVTIAEPVTVGEFLKALNLADGVKFEGYKGGQYLMGPGTFLHVAEWGDTGRCVSGVRLDGNRAVIKTADEVW